MSWLLDTHALLWWAFGDERLPPSARAVLENRANVIFVSAVSAIEVTIKHRIGKLPQAEGLARDFSSEIERMGFRALSISMDEAALAGRMEGDHRDPFDRLLIAQGLLNELTLVSNERLFDSFGVARIW
ncbi:type II toxin-antitoxin system VapC family toxin [Brevundimonas sp.]|uniref:type II toxin-antitoxin system VapC family toxin n=1 Tax=Brevundimonas sp. TaxID=1871086 RepID=UPI003D0D38EC